MVDQINLRQREEDLFCGRELLIDALNDLRQLQIHLCETPDVMGREGDLHSVVRDRKIWVMVELIRWLNEQLNELGRHLEATSKGILRLQIASFEAPLRILSRKSLNGLLLSDSRQVCPGGGEQT